MAFGGALVGLVVVGIGVSNVQRYFVEQAGDFSSWNSHSTAATYIGVTEDALRTELGTGKSLADVAIAHGKTRDGLIAALVAAQY